MTARRQRTGKTREPLLSYGQKPSGLKGSSPSQSLHTRGPPAVISNFQTTWSCPLKDGTLVQHICSLWLVAFHSYCCDFLAISSGIAGICRTHRKSLIRTISTELTWCTAACLAMLRAFLHLWDHRVFIRSSKESLSMDIPPDVNIITINRIIFPPASPPKNKHWEKECQ